MAFVKRFSGNNEKDVWREVSLTDDEELLAEEIAFDENLRLMAECIVCAKNIAKSMELKEYQSDIVSVALALFHNVSKTQIMHKEEMCMEKFERAVKG